MAIQCRCIKQLFVWRRETRGPGGTAGLVDGGKSPAKVELNPGLAPGPQTPLHSIVTSLPVSLSDPTSIVSEQSKRGPPWRQSGDLDCLIVEV